MITSINEYKQFLNESSEETIRVTCAGLARIIIDGKYLFILNKNSVKIGKPSYGPCGGALEFEEAARPFLESLNCLFEKGMDLRLMMPTSNFEKYLEWFNTKQNREASALREVYEELVDEEKVINLDGIESFPLREQYIKTNTEDKLSARQGFEGTKTKGIYEIYSVTLPEEGEKQILEYVKNSSDQKVILLTKEEALTDPRLGTHCKYIL